MGGSAPPAQGSFEKVNLDPQYAQQLRGQSAQLAPMTQAYQGAANQAAGGMQTNFQQFAPQLQSNFTQFNPGLQTNFAAAPTLDARSQTLMGYADQARNSQLGQLQAANAQKFAGTPGIADVLNSQATMQSQLQANPMLFAASQDQYQRQQQEMQLSNQARLQQSQQAAALQQQGNQAQLQNTEALSGLAGAGNAALAQRLQMQAQPLAAQQNILAVLGQLGSLFGSRFAAPLDSVTGNTLIQQSYPNGANMTSISPGGGVFGNYLVPRSPQAAPNASTSAGLLKNMGF
jgi:hypothetical protein